MNGKLIAAKDETVRDLMERFREFLASDDPAKVDVQDFVAAMVKVAFVHGEAIARRELRTMGA